MQKLERLFISGPRCAHMFVQTTSCLVQKRKFCALNKHSRVIPFWTVSFLACFSHLRFGWIIERIYVRGTHIVTRCDAYICNTYYTITCESSSMQWGWITASMIFCQARLPFLAKCGLKMYHWYDKPNTFDWALIHFLLVPAMYVRMTSCTRV